MDDLRLGAVEARFADLIWAHEPLSSRALVALCAEELDWKKSTTYTQVRRLADKGLLQNEHSIVTPLVSRDQVQREESDRFVSRTFGGSLPGFVAAFLKGRTLSDAEAEELKQLIDQHRG